VDCEIFLIRHAQSHPRASVPDAQWPLSDLGRLQAQALAPLLAPLEIEEVISSPYRRCLDTVAPFVGRQGVSLRVKHDLRERTIVRTLIRDFAEIWHRSWEDFHFCLPECESSHVAQQRMLAAMHGIARESTGRRVGVSSHGNVIGLFLNTIEPSYHRAHTERLRNPDVVRVLYRDERFHWDEGFRLAGLDALSSSHASTPMDHDA